MRSGNDTACDWAGDLVEESGLAPLSRPLAAVVAAEEDYLDADLASKAVAACEVIARLNGRWGVENPYTEDFDRWVRSQTVKPTPELLELARQAIDRILAEDSELKELWDGDPDWLAAMADLRERVGP